MRYIVYDTKDPQERNREFEADIPPRIGKILSLGQRTYKVMDVEYFLDKQDSLQVRGALRRLS